MLNFIGWTLIVCLSMFLISVVLAICIGIIKEVGKR